MARIRKIPDTWTLEIHAIVLKNSRQAEHEEIGGINTTRRSSVYSNIKRGGRGAQKKETLETERHDKTKLSILEHQTWWERSSKESNARNKKTRQDEAQYTRTSNVVGEELKRKKRSKQKDTTRQSSAYSNIKRGGRAAQSEGKEMSRGKEDQTFEP